VREAIFNRIGDAEGLRVLDVYAGTGALGIEAASRGARAVVFVEKAPRCLGVLRRNLTDLGLGAISRVMAGDARSAIRALGRAGNRFDLVFLDPPYASGEAAGALSALVEASVLAPGALVVVESGRRHPVAAVEGLAPLDERRYGDTVITRFSVPAGGAATADAAGDETMAKGVSRVSRALFPASFDPVTNGHLDIVMRGLQVFDELVLAVATNLAKTGTFSLEERMDMLSTTVDGIGGVEVTAFEGLTVDFAREIGAGVIIRGFRAMSDFEYEFEMALMNRHLNPDVETIFMMTSPENLYVSSSRLKELVRFGRDVSEFVPPVVAKMLRERLAPV
jgi:pantetheine-phosphate adenylyltransferase